MELRHLAATSYIVNVISFQALSRNVLAEYVLHSGNYYGNSPGGAVPLDGAGRLRPAARSETKGPMRQPHETLRDPTHLSQAHTQYVLF